MDRPDGMLRMNFGLDSVLNTSLDLLSLYVDNPIKVAVHLLWAIVCGSDLYIYWDDECIEQ